MAVEAKSRYLKMAIDKIADFDHDGEEWQVVNLPEDPDVVELPG